MYLGELPTENARTVSGSFYVVNETIFFIQLFSFDTTEYEGKIPRYFVFKMPSYGLPFTERFVIINFHADVYLYYFPTGTPVTDEGIGGGRIGLSSK